MSTPSLQTFITDSSQVLNLGSISAVRSVVAVALANANTGTPLNPNLTTQQLWNEFYQVVTEPKSNIESFIANQMMKFLFSPPAPGGAGADKQVIFNDGGVLAGDAGLVYNKTTDALTVAGLVTAGSATITGAATVGTTLGVTSDLTVGTSPFALKVFPATNRVLINQAAVLQGSPLEISSQLSGDALSLFGRALDNLSSITFRANGSPTSKASIQGSDVGLEFLAGATVKQSINPTTGDVTVSLGNLVMGTSGKGIDFTATASGSGTMTSELLNDYEEGTWVPVVKFGGASVGITGTFTGRYTKVGRAVTINGIISFSNKGSSTGTATITGLPFTSANAAAEYTAVSLRLGAVSFLNAFQAVVTSNSTTIELEQITTGGVASVLSDTNFSNSSLVIVNFTYTV